MSSLFVRLSCGAWIADVIANEIENVEVVCIDVEVFFVVFGEDAWPQI